MGGALGALAVGASGSPCRVSPQGKGKGEPRWETIADLA